jgi:hypothetical protein
MKIRMDREERHGPTVTNHADAFGFCLAVELGTLHEILLATYTLGVAEAGFG